MTADEDGHAKREAIRVRCWSKLARGLRSIGIDCIFHYTVTVHVSYTG